MYRYLIMSAAILIGTTKVLIQSRLTRGLLNNTADFSVYNCIVFTGIGTVYLIQGGLGNLTGTIMLYALSYAVFYAVFQLSYTIALKNGPIAISALMCNFSVGFVVLFGMIRYGDMPSRINTVGFVFLVISLLLSADLKKALHEKISAKWLITSLCAAIFNAGGAITVTAFGKEFGAESNSALLAMGNLTAAVLMLICCIIFDGREKHTVAPTVKNFLCMFSVSVVLTAYQPFMLRGIKLFSSSVYFPLMNTATICIISVVSVVFFHDRLKRTQLWGLISGLIAIVLLTI